VPTAVAVAERPVAPPPPAAEPVGGRPPIGQRLRKLDTFRSLRNNPNYRLYWYGALTSNVGTWMQQVAQGWLVYQLTGSALMLGTVSFATSIPVLFFSLWGGVLADRFERRRLMVWTQSASMLLAFILSFLTLKGVETITHIVVLAFLNGVANAFNAPVRQSIVSDLVKKEDLQNAIAINSTQFQLSQSLGPAFAGLTLAAVGPGWCFFLNGLSFLAVIWTLVVMDVPPLPPRKRASALQSIKESFVYVRGQPVITGLLFMAAVPALFGTPFRSMLPAFAESVLRVGPTGLGVMQSAVGLGAVCGALTMASVGPKWRSGGIQLGAVMLMGFALEGFGLSKIYVLTVVLLFVVGFAQMTYNTLNQTFLQHMVADEMRGRVLSVLTLVTFGLMPFGAMQAGVVANSLGPPMSMVLGGCVCVLAGLAIVSRFPSLRTVH
jgi:MFS family permease